MTTIIGFIFNSITGREPEFAFLVNQLGLQKGVSKVGLDFAYASSVDSFVPERVSYSFYRLRAVQPFAIISECRCDKK